MKIEVDKRRESVLINRMISLPEPQCHAVAVIASALERVVDAAVAIDGARAGSANPGIAAYNLIHEHLAGARVLVEAALSSQLGIAAASARELYGIGCED